MTWILHYLDIESQQGVNEECKQDGTVITVILAVKKVFLDKIEFLMSIRVTVIFILKRVLHKMQQGISGFTLGQILNLWLQLLQNGMLELWNNDRSDITLGIHQRIVAQHLHDTFVLQNK